MRSQLADAVKRALEAANPPPANESETCFRIIDPLLLAMGYSHQEITLQGLDAAKQKPDYTILPGIDGGTWFLEAKQWGVALDDNAAIQGVNYANTQGKRWVVVSNGKEWRLYDNEVFGQVAQKLVCTARLEEPDFVTFLEALSKASFVQNKLEDYVRNRRLYDHLGTELKDPGSAVVCAMVKALRKLKGLQFVGGSDVVRYLSDRSGSPVHEDCTETATADTTPSEEQARGLDKPSASRISSRSLAEVTSEDVTHKKPSSLQFEDGHARPLRSWWDLALTVSQWVAQRGSLPTLPYYVSARSKAPYVCERGSPAAERMREPVPLPSPFDHIVVEGHNSAAGHCAAAARFLAAAGFDPQKAILTWAGD